MKTTLKIIILFAICHSPFAITAQASLAIYTGTGRATFYGNELTMKGTGKSILLLDTQTLDAYEVVGTAFYGVKTYSIRHLQNFHIGTLDAGAAIYTYLATASDDGTNLESVFYKGKNTAVSLDADSYDFLPKTLAGPSRILSAGFLGEVDESFTLDLKNSRFSNANALTLQDLVAAAEIVFQKLGYTKGS